VKQTVNRNQTGFTGYAGYFLPFLLPAMLLNAWQAGKKGKNKKSRKSCQKKYLFFSIDLFVVFVVKYINKE